jgi:phosphopentomutase
MIKHTPAPDLPKKRVIIIVLDGAGVGALPDADQYGDQGANTLKNIITQQGPLKLDNLRSLGLYRVLQMPEGEKGIPSRACYYGRMSPISPGKDTTSGHWELAGLVLKKPFPVYPNGFPDEVINAFKKLIGRDILGNIAASGTVIINDLGDDHLKTGYPIVYTSADSVFQIAAHDSIIPPDLLYEWCKKAREILSGEHAVGRVIARPFTGKSGSFIRTSGRHDFSIAPPGNTILDQTSQAGYPVAVIGKVADVFAHRGITIHRSGGDNDATTADLSILIDQITEGLIWATYGDFDTIYGHRNDSKGFALALEQFDRQLALFIDRLKESDLLFITADHGCDPTYPTTDHTREYVPIMVWGLSLPQNIDVGIRTTYADLAASAAQWLQIKAPENGGSFLTRL